MLYPAMRRFFAGKLPHIYSDCVLIFRHIYDRNRPERSYRDHDNIELNMVVDIVALYLPPDDAPPRCAHYYCNAQAAIRIGRRSTWCPVTVCPTGYPMQKAVLWRGGDALWNIPSVSGKRYGCCG